MSDEREIPPLPADAWPPMIRLGDVVPDPNPYDGRRIVARRVKREHTGRITVLGEFQRGGKPEYIVFGVPRYGAVVTCPSWSGANWEFER